MALLPSTIIRRAYVAIGAWQGTPAEINAQYNADTNFEQVVSESFPPQSMYDMLTGVENEIALAVSMNPENVLRPLIGDTVSVASGGVVFTTTDTGLPMIGVWGQIRDAATLLPLTQGMHEDEITAIVNGPTGLFKSSYRSYAARPPRVYATVPNIKIDCCGFSYAIRAAVIAANGPLLFQQLSEAYFTGLMTKLKNQDASYTSLSNEYQPQYAQWLAAQNPPTNLVEQSKA